MKKVVFWSCIVVGIIAIVIFVPFLFNLLMPMYKKYCIDLGSVYYILTTLGIASTIAAIFIAIQIPRKIAEQQNKISLFEKRWEIYQALLNIQIFKTKCKNIENFLTYGQRISYYIHIMGAALFERVKREKDEKILTIIGVKKLKQKLHQAEFLFNFKDISDLKKLQKHFETFVDSCTFYLYDHKVESQDLVKIEDEYKEEFIKSFDIYGEKIISEIEEYLKLSKK